MTNVPAIMFCQDKFMKVFALTAALAAFVAAPGHSATMKWTFDGWILGYEDPTGVYADHAPKLGSNFTAAVTFDSEIGRNDEPQYDADWIWHSNVKDMLRAPTIEFSFDPSFTVGLTSFGVGLLNLGADAIAQATGGGFDTRFPGWNTSVYIDQAFAFPDGVKLDSEFTAEAVPLLQLQNTITLHRDVPAGELMDVFFAVTKMTAERIDAPDAPAPVPLPASALLMLTGLASFGAIRSRRR